MSSSALTWPKLLLYFAVLVLFDAIYDVFHVKLFLEVAAKTFEMLTSGPRSRTTEAGTRRQRLSGQRRGISRV